MSEIYIGVMPGDGIGPKITGLTLPIVEAGAEMAGLHPNFVHIPVSGEAFDQTGEHLPDSSVTAATKMDAVLKGPFGGPPNSDDPKWQGLEKKAILPLREKLGLYANLRPLKILGEIGVHLSPLENRIAQGTDLMIVREFTGDAYYGDSDHGVDEETGERWAYETIFYKESQVEKIVKMAIKLARERGDKLSWVHKTNVLEETGGLWRAVVKEVAAEEGMAYETIGYSHVDAEAAALIGKVKTGTIVTTNMFGDILSDEGAQVIGSLGLGASASLAKNDFGLYEPIHGSAPDIEDAENANPIGMILSAALMFRHSLNRPEVADVIEQAVADVLDDLHLPADLYAMTSGEIEGLVAKKVTATEFGKLVLEKIKKATA